MHELKPKLCDCTGCKHRRDVVKRFKCLLCQKPPVALFMVQDEVWLEAGFQKKDLVCFGCFLEKLGRPIKLEDFKEKGNDLLRVGYQLAMRDIGQKCS